MKRNLLLLLAVFCGLHVMSEDFVAETTEGVPLWFSVLNEDAKTCIVKKYYNSDIEGVVTIPSEAEGYRVTAIAYRAFYNCSNVTEFVLPETIDSIGNQAFAGCRSIERLIVPLGVRSMRVSQTISNCSSLKILQIPVALVSKNWSYVSSMVNDFGNLSSIADLYLDAPTMRDWYSKGVSCYYGMGGSYVMPKMHMLINGTEVTEVVIPEEATNIAPGAFHGLSEITKVVIPSSVTNIGAMAFRCCSSLSDLQLPNTVTRLPDGVFSRTAINELIVPEGVDTLDQYVADQCPNLTHVSLPSTLKAMGMKLFDGSLSLAKVTSYISTPFVARAPYDWDSTTSYIEDSFSGIQNNVTLYVPKDAKTKYEALPSWASHFSDIVEFDINGIEAIGNGNIKKSENEGIFDLSGRRINKSQLKRGIYIANGKKILIK